MRNWYNDYFMSKTNKKLKLLVLAHRFPFPPDKGDRIRSFYWLTALTARHEVDLLTFSQEPVPENYLRELQRMVRRVTVIQQAPWTTGWRLVKGLLTGQSLTESYFQTQASVGKMRELWNSDGYDRCLAICSSMGAIAVQTVPKDRLIIDLVDVDSVKWRMYSQKHSGLQRWVYNRESKTVSKLEKRLAQRSRVLVTVSRRECDLVRDVAPESLTLAIPNGVDTDYFKPSDIPQPLDRLVFVGQMDYFPNVDAVVWFAEKVWPELIAKYPTLRWNIVGRNPTKAVRDLENLPNIRVTGAVPDVRPYLVSAIAIAPLGVAGGVQNKVLEAMSAGRPVVVTPSVADGLDVQSQEDLLVAESAKEWVLAIDLLLSDPNLADALAGRARQTCTDRFTWDRILPRMVECVEHGGILTSLPEKNAETLSFHAWKNTSDLT